MSVRIPIRSIDLGMYGGGAGGEGNSVIVRACGGWVRISIPTDRDKPSIRIVGDFSIKKKGVVLVDEEDIIRFMRSMKFPHIGESPEGIAWELGAEVENVKHLCHSLCERRRIQHGPDDRYAMSDEQVRGMR